MNVTEHNQRYFQIFFGLLATKASIEIDGAFVGPGGAGITHDTRWGWRIHTIKSFVGNFEFNLHGSRFAGAVNAGFSAALGCAADASPPLVTYRQNTNDVWIDGEALDRLIEGCITPDGDTLRLNAETEMARKFSQGMASALKGKERD